jgi:hypothetical protein
MGIVELNLSLATGEIVYVGGLYMKALPNTRECGAPCKEVITLFLTITRWRIGGILLGIIQISRDSLAYLENRLQAAGRLKEFQSVPSRQGAQN